MADVLTFGCRLNTVESEAIRALSGHLPDTLVVNTCAVTLEAERQARQAIGRAHREQPLRPIVVTGCAAQIDPARWAALPGVRRVLGNLEKLTASAWHGTASAVGDIGKASGHRAATLPGMMGRARAFLDVQQGCDHHCTFCIIPQGRGPNRSVPEAEVIAQVRRLVAADINEVVLTGVDLASYEPSLASLLRAILRAVPELSRLRLSSLDPAMLDDAFWDVLANEHRLMPHLHLSVQAGSDLILKRMRRRHSQAGALAVIGRARAVRPGLGIGADLIAGFPTETEALFQETLGFVDEAALPYVHVFPYSARPGTPAARMPQVAMALRRERAARLRAAAAGHAAAFHAGMLGTEQAIVVERGESGHTEAFAPVRFREAGAPVGAPVGALVRCHVVATGPAGLEVC